jgi:hypothetical protein
MRILAGVAAVVAVSVATPALADWTCQADKSASRENFVAASVTVSDDGVVKSTKLRWAPTMTSNTVVAPPSATLIYNLPDGKLDDAVLKTLGIRFVMGGVSYSRLFIALQLDGQGAPVVTEWATFGQDTSPLNARNAATPIVALSYPVNRGDPAIDGLFDKVTAGGSRALQLRLIAGDGKAVANAAYDISAGVVSNPMAAEALANAQKMVPDFKRKCKRA